MANQDKVNPLVEHHIELAKRQFWQEDYRSSTLWDIMRNYKRDLIREWAITDLIPNGDKFLVKWEKRIIPCSDEELDKQGIKK